MPGPVSSPAPVPIPASDALYVDTLRTAWRCYERGDYQRAGALFQDAAALAGYRPEAFVFATLGAQLHAFLVERVLVSKDAAFATAAEVRGV